LTPGPLHVRPLTREDAPEYRAFRLAGLQEAPLAFGRSAEEYRHETLSAVADALQELPGERVTLGAFLHGTLVGAVTALRNPALKQRHKGSIYAVYVAPHARGQGTADALLTHLLAWATSAGLLQVTLSVSVPQVAARRVYARHGFTVYGLERRAMRVDGQDVDEELMVRFLDI